MKLILALTTIFILMGCGEEAYEPSILERLNQNVEVDENDSFTDSELESLKTICAALENKEFYFQSSIRTNRDIAFDYLLSTKQCEKDEFDKAQSITGTLAVQNGEMSYSPSESGTRFNTSVLVKDSKMLADLCEEKEVEEFIPGDLLNPEEEVQNLRYTITGNYGTWYYIVNNGSGTCGKREAWEEGATEMGSNDSLCIEMMVGTRNEDGSFKIKDIEQFEVVVKTGDLSGVVVKQTLASARMCAQDETYYIRSQFNKL